MIYWKSGEQIALHTAANTGGAQVERQNCEYFILPDQRGARRERFSRSTASFPGLLFKIKRTRLRSMVNYRGLLGQ